MPLQKNIYIQSITYLIRLSVGILQRKMGKLRFIMRRIVRVLFAFQKNFFCNYFPRENVIIQLRCDIVAH